MQETLRDEIYVRYHKGTQAIVHTTPENEIIYELLIEIQRRLVKQEIIALAILNIGNKNGKSK